MTTTQHPLTDGAIAGIWTKHASTLGVFTYDGRRPSSDLPVVRHALRAAFDAGREHERTTTPAEPLARTLLAVPEGHGAPHHDAGKIKAEDYVLQVDKGGFIRAGIAHRQDQDGDWRTAGGRLITNAARRADRPDALTVWPAPTPPAVEVEMPSEHPAHLRDVEGWDGERFAYMALDGGGHWCGVDQDGVARVWPLRWIAAATLPDGTRARRDGERPDGEPRFVKTQEV